MSTDTTTACRNANHRQFWGIYLGLPDLFCVCELCAKSQRVKLAYSPGCKCARCRGIWALLFAIRKAHRHGKLYVVPQATFPEGEFTEVCNVAR